MECLEKYEVVGGQQYLFPLFESSLNLFLHNLKTTAIDGYHMIDDHLCSDKGLFLQRLDQDNLYKI